MSLKASWWQTYCCGHSYIKKHMVVTLHYNCMVHSCGFPMEDNAATAKVLLGKIDTTVSAQGP